MVLAVVVLLMAASVLVGLAVTWRRLYIADDYFLAGRQLPWYAVATSLAGAGLGLESLLGMAGLAYLVGMAPAALCWGNFLAYSILLWAVLPYLVRKKLSSLGEFLDRRYLPSTRAVYVAVMLAFMIFGVLAPALCRRSGRLRRRPGPPGGTLRLDIPRLHGGRRPGGGGYSVYGGLAATTWAGTLQLLVVLSGGLLLVAVGSHNAGGLAAVVKSNLAADPAA